MIKLKKNKLSYVLFGLAIATLPIAAISASCTAPSRPDRAADAATFTSRKEVEFNPIIETTPTTTPKDPEKPQGESITKVTEKYKNFGFASLHIENGSTISDNGINESLWEGIKKAADDYNEFLRAKKPINTPEFARVYESETQKKPLNFRPTLDFLDGYVSGYTLRNEKLANIIVVSGLKQALSVKSWYWEAVNVNRPILVATLAKAEKDSKAEMDSYPKNDKGESLIPKARKDALEKGIKNLKDKIAAIDNIVVVAVGFDPSVAQKLRVHQFEKPATEDGIGKKAGRLTNEDEKEGTNPFKLPEQGIPEGHWIQIEHPTLEKVYKKETVSEADKKALNNFIGQTMYDIMMDLEITVPEKDAGEARSKRILNKGGTARNETFVLGTKSIKISPAPAAPAAGTGTGTAAAGTGSGTAAAGTGAGTPAAGAATS